MRSPLTLVRRRAGATRLPAQRRHGSPDTVPTSTGPDEQTVRLARDDFRRRRRAGRLRRWRVVALALLVALVLRNGGKVDQRQTA